MGFFSITERDNFNVTNKRWWDKLSKPGRRSEIDLVGDFVKQSKRRWAEFRYFVACNYYNDVILLASLVSKLTGGESHWNWTLAVWVRFSYQLTARKNHCIQKSVRKYISVVNIQATYANWFLKKEKIWEMLKAPYFGCKFATARLTKPQVIVNCIIW